LGPTGGGNQESNTLGLRAIVVDIRPRLARSIIFTTIVVSFLTVKYRFLRLRLRHFIFVTKIRY